MKKQVFQYVKKKKSDKVAIYGEQIQRTKMHKLVTAHSVKVQKVVYRKRVIKNDFSTVPFGFIVKK